MMHIYWKQEISAAIKWSKLHSFECWNQTQILMHFASQHSTTRWSDWKLERKRAGFELSMELLFVQLQAPSIEHSRSYFVSLITSSYNKKKGKSSASLQTLMTMKMGQPLNQYKHTSLRDTYLQQDPIT